MYFKLLICISSIKALRIQFKQDFDQLMGASHNTDYTKSLHFVQNLTDDNFGQVEIYRNEQGKFIMKSEKSFITGDKRHSNFKKVIEFMHHTTNKNILPLLYLQQYHESNVCIEYQKVFVYTEYLNFTLKGLIQNKKNIDEAEIWYLIKTMVELIIQLQENDINTIFSISNIFLTLKGIPSVFMYHFVYNDKKEKYEEQNNFFQYDINREVNIGDKQVLEQDSSLKQLELKPQSMLFSLGKAVLQLINMELIEVKQGQTELQAVKSQLFYALKRGSHLGNFVRLLLTEQDGSKLLSQIDYLLETRQIKVASQIRFNKFRYIVAQQDKGQKTAKELSLSDKKLMDFKSRPLSAANTPIYRLRDNEFPHNPSLDFSIKSKSIQQQQNFFKKKGFKENHQKINYLQPKQKQIPTIQKDVQNFQKQQSCRQKAKSTTENQTENSRTKHSNHHSKLSLISKRNISNSKIDTYLPQDHTSQFSQNTKSHDQQTKNKLQDRRQQCNNLRDMKMDSISNALSNKQNQQSSKPTLRASNRIKQILNQQMSKNRNFSKTYSKFHLQNKTNLLSRKLNELQNLKTQKHKDHFRQQPGRKIIQNIFKTQHDHEEQQSIRYKPFLTQDDQQGDTNSQKEQKINGLFDHSEEKSLNMISSINALDSSNFLSTLEIKKHKNNIKVNSISKKKDLMLSDLRKNQKHPDKTCLKNFFTQNLNPQSVKNQPDRPLAQKELIKNNSNMVQNNSTMFDKKRVKLQTDKIKTVNKQQGSNIKNSFKDQNKENTIDNSQSKIANSKVRRLSVRAKGLVIK